MKQTKGYGSGGKPMKPDFFLMGGGAQAIELFEYMRSEGTPPVGYYAPEENKTLSCFLKWLGDERKTDIDPKAHYMIAVGLIEIRKRIITFLEERCLVVGSFVSKHAYVSSLAVLGKGIVVAPMASITGNAVIGDYVLINMHSAIAHDTIIGNDVVIGPGAMVTGHCVVGNHVTLGANSALLPSTVVEENSEIGILTFPRKRVKEGTIFISAPGDVVRR